MYFNKCPRCGDTALEHLCTHSFCFNCNYSPEDELRTSDWLKLSRIKTKNNTMHELEIHHYSNFDPSIGVGGVS